MTGIGTKVATEARSALDALWEEAQGPLEELRTVEGMLRAHADHETEIPVADCYGLVRIVERVSAQLYEVFDTVASPVGRALDSIPVSGGAPMPEAGGWAGLEGMDKRFAAIQEEAGDLLVAEFMTALEALILDTLNGYSADLDPAGPGTVVKVIHLEAARWCVEGAFRRFALREEAAHA